MRRANAERQRDHRRRLRLGLAQFTIETDAGTIDRLIEHGYLTERGSADRHAIEKALSRALTLELRRRQ